MNDYSSLGLDPYLRATDSLAVRAGSIVTGYDFANYERDAITETQIQNNAVTNTKIGTASIGTANIGTLSFNEISGGTAILGGTANGNGVFNLKNAGGSNIITMNNTGIQLIGQALTMGSNQEGFIFFDDALQEFTLESLSDAIRIQTDNSNFSIGFGTGASLLRINRGDGLLVMTIGTAGNLRIRGTLEQNVVF